MDAEGHLYNIRYRDGADGRLRAISVCVCGWESRPCGTHGAARQEQMKHALITRQEEGRSDHR